MAGRISFACPACSTKLSVSDSSKLGKRIKCPKCQEVFLPEVPDDDEIVDLDDEVEDDEPAQPVIKRRPGGGGKGNKKVSASGGGSNLPLVIGGGVAVLVLAVLGAVFSGAFSSKPLQAPPDSTGATAAVAAPQATPPVAVASSAALTSPPMGPPPGMMPSAAPTSVPKPTAPATSSAEKVLGLRWLPADTELIVHVKVAEILEAPLLKGPLNTPSATEFFKEFEKHVGILPSQIQSITFGVANLSASVAGMASLSPGMGGPGAARSPASGKPFDDLRVIAIFKLKEPVDFNSVSQKVPNATVKEKSGKQYFEVPSDATGTPGLAGWSSESKTVIVGTTKEVLETIDRGETSVPRKEFISIDPQPQLVIASFNQPPDAATMKKMEAAQIQFRQLMSSELISDLQSNVKMSALGLSVKGGFDFQLSILTGTAESATKIKAELQSGLDQVRTAFASVKTTAPPLLAELGEILLSRAKIEDLNQTIKVSTGVPDSEQPKLEQLPAIVMMMAMTGGLGTGMGGMPGFASMGTDSGDGSIIKQPGETESVDAATVEGLPDGMTLTARSAWSFLPADAVNGKLDLALEVLIDVTGDGLETICAATGVTSKKATFDAGGALKKSKRPVLGDIDPLKTFLPFEADESIPLEHPPKTLRVRFAVEAPTSNTAKKIDVLEGSFKLLTATESHSMTIENAPRRAKRPLADPEFKAGSVKLRRGDPGSIPETLKLECGKTHYIGRARGSPGNEISFTEVEKGATIQRIYCSEEDGKFPDDFQIEFKLHADIKEQVVTFRFENIPLPTPESKPSALPEIK